MNVNLRSLVARLNEVTRNGLDSAAGLCLSRTHYDVEVEHYLMKLLDTSDSDMGHILRHYGVNRSRLSADLIASLDKLKWGNARTPSLSPSLVRMMSEAWTIGSLDFGAQTIRSGHTVLALLANEELSRMMRGVSEEFSQIPPEDLQKNFNSITGASAEEDLAGSSPAQAAQQSGAGGPARAGDGKTPNLDQFTIDLTAKAEEGRLDPVLGRDFEVRQVVDILTRRRQNNPILVGEAGVGKTAVVEGFAMRIASGDVPPALRDVRLHTLDLALLQAGAGIKGEFENRLKGLIEEVRSSPIPIILFIDEAHTMIGAGGQAGQNDAANLLKPALARGELRTIAATTWSEYKKYFEKDPALARRFQLIKVEEPSEDTCLVMMRGVVPALERHHNVRILDSGVDAAVRLSHRYLPDRQLPDKAVSVLDTACARLALGQSTIPAPIEDAKRQLDDLDVQKRVLEREAAVGANHSERLGEIAERRGEVEKRLASLEELWSREREAVEKVRTARQAIEAALVAEAAAAMQGADGDATGGDGAAANAVNADPGASAGPVGGAAGEGAGAGATAPAANGAARADLDALRAQLGELTGLLEEIQGETPLIPVNVDAQLVGAVISGWTGIPVGKMLRDELRAVLEMERHLGGRVIGQNHALEYISRRIQTSRAGIEDPSKPKGVFMLVGPSGVGKTETALALSDLLYGGENNLISINMSEFQEPHTVSTLKGSPPGYVGYGEGGVLTEAVRRRPYSVVLLDEVEKAHPDVLELFFQVFDKGVMEDGEGRQIDFRNSVIILTTNAGTDTIMKLTEDPETTPSHEGLVRALKPELNAIFKPAFLGRMVIIPYFPVRDEHLKQIIRLKLGKVQRRMQATHRLALDFGEELIDAVAARCTEVESGARNVDNILTNTLLPDLSRMLLSEIVEGRKPERIQVSVGEDGGFSYRLDEPRKLEISVPVAGPAS